MSTSVDISIVPGAMVVKKLFSLLGPQHDLQQEGVWFPEGSDGFTPSKSVVAVVVSASERVCAHIAGMIIDVL